MNPDDSTLAELAQDFERHLRAKNRSRDTIKSYLNVIRSLIKYLDDQGKSTAAESIQQSDLEDYIAQRLETRSAADTAKHYRSLQQYFKWLTEEDEVPANPMARMKAPAVAEKPVPVLPDDALQSLLKSCEGKTFENRRDTALLRLFIDSGARLSELANLTLDDVDWDQEVARVIGKGNKVRACPFGAKTGEALRRYIRLRRKHKCGDDDALWLGKKGPLTSSGVAQILGRRASDAGVPRLHPHMLRHGFAHAWLAAGGQERDLMRLMGWSSPQMLSRYGASLADQRARDAHRRMGLGDRF